MIEIRHARMDSTAATLRAYDQLYEESGIRHRDSFYLWLLDQLAPRPGQTLLDISCGEGRLVTLARGRGLRAWGTDFSRASLVKARSADPAGQWFAGDGEGLPCPDGAVDCVTHIGSLEHYIHPARGAAEIARVLKPGGRACILLPNAFGFWGNIKTVLLTGEVFDDFQPLQRYATRRTWENLLTDGGLRIERRVGYGEVEWPRTGRDARWMLARPQKLARFLLALATPLNLANHLVFICGRA